MSKFGLGIHLLNFDGDVLIKDNSFTDTRLDF